MIAKYKKKKKNWTYQWVWKMDDSGTSRKHHKNNIKLELSQTFVIQYFLFYIYLSGSVISLVDLNLRVQFFMNWASNVAYMLLDTNNLNYTWGTVIFSIFYLAYLCRCPGLDVFILHLCDLCFIFSLTFIVINLITSLKKTHLFFIHLKKYFLLFLDDNVGEESE